MVHSQPWFTDRIKEEIRIRCMKECMWKNNPTEYNLNAFYQQRRHVASIIKQVQRSYYISKLQENRTNFKEIFTITNKLLGRIDSSPLPPYENPDSLAQEFSDYFQDKINTIMLQLNPTTDCPIDNRYIEMGFLTQHRLDEFNEVREEEVLKLLTTAPAKSCDLDPLPSRLLVKHCLEVVPVITQIVNASLTHGEFSSQLKTALVHPLLKKPGTDCIFRNYRPISNLSFLSKLIERIVCNQITYYTGTTGMAEKFKSAYRAFHLTETALIKVKDDILRSIDNQKITYLILLDLSAAFDTVSHHLLLNRLKHHFGIHGTVLKWFRSYMTDRSQKITLSDTNNNKLAFSKQAILKQGVPQGSVLGPILFTSPLGDICRKHDVSFQSYADDQQIYLSFSPSQPGGKDKCLQSLTACISDIRLWMRTNLLKLNDDKTEFIVFGTRSQLSKIGEVSIKIGNDTISAVPLVRNLGVHFDKELKWTVHINHLTSNLYHILRKVAHIRHLLNEEATKIIIQALVLSKIDYCNSIYQGAPTYAIDKLQRLQNMGCRIIRKVSKYDHITPHLIELHWLRIREHVVYKVCVLVFKCINGLAPQYLSETIIHAHACNLRSSTFNYLPTVRCNTAITQNSAFSSTRPRLWNMLPNDIKTSSSLDVFKAKLKTFLFSASYDLHQ